MDYPVIVVRLSDEDGGGFMGYVPDLVGCMSDGETPQEAISNTIDAIEEWIDAAKERGLPVPTPGSAARRERVEKERLIKALKSVTQDVDHIDGRLRDIETTIREIEEKIENQEAWTRFASLSGIPGAPETSKQALLF